MLTTRTMHLHVCWGCNVDAYLLRKREQNLVFDDLRVESGLAELLSNVLGRFSVLRRPSYMRSLSENAQMLLGELWIRRLIEFAVDLLLTGKVAKAKNPIFGGVARTLGETA